MKYRIEVNIAGKWSAYWKGRLFRTRELGERALKRARASEAPSMADAFRLVEVRDANERAAKAANVRAAKAANTRAAKAAKVKS